MTTPRRVLRPSLRTNVVAMVLAMLLLPQVIVFAWSATERDIAGKLQASARESANEAAEALADSPADEVADRLADVASRHTSRIRVVKPDGTERFDIDRDRATDIVHQIGTLFFGPDGAPTLREFDETLGPVPVRPEYLRVTHADVPPARAPLVEGTSHGRYAFGSLDRGAEPARDPEVETGCRRSPADKLLVCHAARIAPGDGRDVIYVQESSRRAVRALYDLRYHLLRLSLLMLPLALVFSWWMGRRMVRPIESLRERVLEKARDANPRADLDPVATDEIDELTGAFNDLLEALDEKRRENEAFVADLVHEFKNPVAAIRACAESLDAGSVDAQRAQRLAKILADSSMRLDGLVSQFLELARAEAGLPNEARANVDLAALARGVVSTFEPRMPETTFVVDAEGDAAVFGVEPRLDSLVRNLVDNASAFAGDRGEVRVRVARQDGRVVLEVSDSGPGIAEADLPRVFERFFTTRATAETASETRARRGRGTGLGLALVKAVAEAHGGDVSAASKPGAGATFRVVLPAAARAS